MTMKTLQLLQSSAASPNGRMTWLSRLVLALVIMAVAPNVAMADDVYSVVGDEALTGENWNVSSEKTVMSTNDNNIYTYTFEDVNLTAGTTYNYKVIKNYAYANGQWPGDGTSGNATITPSVTATYDVTITFNLSTKKITSSLYHDCYLKVTSGAKSAWYVMSPSRSRKGGNLSKICFTRSLKADRIKKDLEIDYGTSVNADVYDNKGGNKLNDKALNPITLTEKHSYTWLWDDEKGNVGDGGSHGWNCFWRVADNAGGNASGASDPFSASQTYYLIGNFENADATININPSKDVNRTKLVRYVYKGGRRFQRDAWQADDANADSIIYRASIPRPAVAKGWGELYLAIADGGLYDSNMNFENNDWNYVYRPQVQTYNYDNDGDWGDKVGLAGLDGTALEGALFKSNGTRYDGNSTWGDYDEKSRDQALNPVVASDIKSYTFSFNVTYHTYRIELTPDNEDNHMYLAGPAVASATKKGNKDANLNGDVSEWLGSGIQLTWSDAEQCYRYVDADGNDKPVKMVAGEPFVFITGLDFRKTSYGEDNHVPTTIKNLISDYGVSTDNTNFDTQYVNRITTNDQTAENKYNPDIITPITWGLYNRDNQDAIIRLYIKRVGDQSRIFYTVNRWFQFHGLGDDYDLESFTKTTGDNGVSYVRAFSDYHAYKLPAGMKVYIVTGVKNQVQDKSTSQIGNSDLKDISSLDYIPANTGVLLATNATNIRENGHNKVVHLEVYDTNPDATYTGTEKNYLQAAMSTTPIYEAGKNENFVFNVNNGVPGFYYPNSGLKASNNSSFLKFTGASAAKSAFIGSGKLAFGFGSYEAPNTVTGINNVEAAKASDNTPYYTMQGMTVNGKPTVAGVYVHNGKKVIIK